MSLSSEYPLTKYLKVGLLFLPTLPTIAFADRYGIYDDNYGSSSGDILDGLMMIVLCILSVYWYFSAWADWSDRKSSGKPTKTDTTEIGFVVFVGLCVGGLALLPCMLVLGRLGVPPLLVYVILVAIWTVFKCTYVLTNDDK